MNVRFINFLGATCALACYSGCDLGKVASVPERPDGAAIQVLAPVVEAPPVRAQPVDL
jgi:hypothetical protein